MSARFPPINPKFSVEKHIFQSFIVLLSISTHSKMGRVAKYKKIKACDPYSKKNGGKVDLNTVGIWGFGDNGRKPKKRSRRAEVLRANKITKREQEDGFDLPPSGRRDEFDLKDLMGSVKKQKLVNPMKDDAPTQDQDLFAVDRVKINGNVASIPKTDEDEKKMARILNIKTQVKKELEKKESRKHARMEGESKNAFNKRAKAETRQIIKQTIERKNPGKTQKKKEFLTSKKKKKKGSFAGDEDFRGGPDDRESDILITGERAIAMVDEVKFGEQAERPPVFRHLPRGAKREEGSLKKKAGGKPSSGMTAEDIEAESKSMELMRRKIQAQYAAVKLKRRLAGDFHL